LTGNQPPYLTDNDFKFVANRRQRCALNATFPRHIHIFCELFFSFLIFSFILPSSGGPKTQPTPIFAEPEEESHPIHGSVATQAAAHALRQRIIPEATTASKVFSFSSTSNQNPSIKTRFTKIRGLCVLRSWHRFASSREQGVSI